MEDEDILVVDVGRYGFVKLQCYTSSYGFEELDTYTDSHSLFEGLWEDGPLLYEIEEFDENGSCRIRYCR